MLFRSTVVAASGICARYCTMGEKFRLGWKAAHAAAGSSRGTGGAATAARVALLADRFAPKAITIVSATTACAVQGCRSLARISFVPEIRMGLPSLGLTALTLSPMWRVVNAAVHGYARLRCNEPATRTAA